MVYFSRLKIFFIFVVCLGGIFLAMPNVLPKGWMPDDSRVNLGLDLRGGSYLLLEVRFDAYLKDQLQALVDDVRLRLRKERIGYSDLGYSGGGVVFSLRNSDDQPRMEEAIGDLLGDLRLSEDAGVFSLKYHDTAIKNMRKSVIEQSIEIVRRRVDETGTREPIIQRQGDSRILLQVPGLKDPEQLKRLLGKTAKMTFHLMDEGDPFPSAPRSAPADSLLLKGDDGDDQISPRYYMVKRKVAVSGDLLVHAAASFSEGRPVVNFRFNNLGAKKFADITRNNVGKPFAVVLDKKVISAPVINEPIPGGSGMISGNFSVETANDLALLLRAGALPAPLNIVEERTVGPSLGADSIEAGTNAAIIGVILVAVFMAVSYGLFGIFSNIALLMNMVLILGALSLFQATLTMPGIAGIVLTMGMAVDANVLIFERIREEMKIGRTPIAAIDQGFSQAFKTIVDSNITTLMATLLLFLFGSGPVKGFAVTLSIGIIASMFSAIMLTRLMVVTWLRRKKPKTLPL